MTKKKYFDTPTQTKINQNDDDKELSEERDRMAQRIKEFEAELLKMKEKDDCIGKLKEERGMGSKGTSSIKGAKDFNEFEDIYNYLELYKNVEDVAGVNEEAKVYFLRNLNP